MKREKQFSEPLTRLLMAETPFLRCKGSLDGNRRDEASPLAVPVVPF